MCLKVKTYIKRCRFVCVCVVFFFFFLIFIITQYDNVLLKKFKIDTHLNDTVPLIWTENISLFVCIGSVQLYSLRALCLWCPHRTSIGAAFVFQSLASTPSVGANGNAEGLVLVDVVGSGDSLHTPSQSWGELCVPWLLRVLGLL